MGLFWFTRRIKIDFVWKSGTTFDSRKTSACDWSQQTSYLQKMQPYYEQDWSVLPPENNRRWVKLDDHQESTSTANTFRVNFDGRRKSRNANCRQKPSTASVISILLTPFRHRATSASCCKWYVSFGFCDVALPFVSICNHKTNYGIYSCFAPTSNVKCTEWNANGAAHIHTAKRHALAVPQLKTERQNVNSSIFYLKCWINHFMYKYMYLLFLFLVGFVAKKINCNKLNDCRIVCGLQTCCEQ